MKTTLEDRFTPGPPAVPDPLAPRPPGVAPLGPVQPLALQDGDFYLEGDRMVFTAAYHLRRGYCCGSQCRHCPYRECGR
jgi:hypothetical protein